MDNFFLNHLFLQRVARAVNQALQEQEAHIGQVNRRPRNVATVDIDVITRRLLD